MSDLARKTLARRSLQAGAVFAACITLSGCYACSLNGGWEGQINPFCVEKNTLIGPISLSESVPPPSLGEQPIRSSTPTLVEPRGIFPPPSRPTGRPSYRLLMGRRRQP